MTTKDYCVMIRFAGSIKVGQRVVRGDRPWRYLSAGGPSITEADLKAGADEWVARYTEEEAAREVRESAERNPGFEFKAVPFGR